MTYGKNPNFESKNVWSFLQTQKVNSIEFNILIFEFWRIIEDNFKWIYIIQQNGVYLKPSATATNPTQKSFL